MSRMLSVGSKDFVSSQTCVTADDRFSAPQLPKRCHCLDAGVCLCQCVSERAKDLTADKK